MNIGGLQKNSLIDYPGKLSSVIFCSGCNFDCPYCHNPQLVGGSGSGPTGLNTDAICNFLEDRRGFLDGVVVSGGEPTLQKGLAELCRSIKAFGYPVKLDTNGSRPQVLEQLIARGLVDYIAMDLKTDPLGYAAYIKPGCNPDSILSSIRIIMQSGLDYEFRTTCVKPIVTAETLANISQRIQGARLYALQRFRNTAVLHPEFFRDSDHQCGDDELMQLKAVADRRVANCVIR